MSYLLEKKYVSYFRGERKRVISFKSNARMLYKIPSSFENADNHMTNCTGI